MAKLTISSQVLHITYPNDVSQHIVVGKDILESEKSREPRKRSIANRNDPGRIWTYHQWYYAEKIDAWSFRYISLYLFSFSGLLNGFLQRWTTNGSRVNVGHYLSAGYLFTSIVVVCSESDDTSSHLECHSDWYPHRVFFTTYLL